MTKASPLVIEFIGLPGSGKTTVAQLVAAELALTGYRCFSLSTLASPEAVKKNKGGVLHKLRTFFGLILSNLLYPSLVVRACLFAVHVRPLSIATFQRLMTFLTRLDFFRSVIHEGYDVIVFDQGSLQNVWSIATTGDHSLDDGRYLNLLTESVLRTFSPLVVRVCIEATEAAERISHRTTMRSRFDKMSPEQVKVMLKRYDHVFSEMAATVSKFQTTHYLEVDGQHPPYQSVNSIIHFIKQALTSA